MVNDHYWSTRLGLEWLCCEPKWLTVKWWLQRDLISHRLGSLLGAIKLTILYAFIFRVNILMLKSGRLYYTKQGFEILASFKKNVTNHLEGTNLQNNLHSFIISSTPSLKNIAQNSSHSFLGESAHFRRFPVFYLLQYCRNTRNFMHANLSLNTTKFWHTSLYL